MRLKIKVLFLTLAMVCTLVAPARAATPAKTISVGPNGQYKDINSAVRVAQPGEVIYLEKGTYRGSVTIDKPLQLIGEAGVILDGEGKGDVVLVQNTHNVTISNLVIRNSGGSGVVPYAGINISSSSQVSVKNVAMSEVEYGLYLKSSHYCSISYSSISGKTELQTEDRGDGIDFWNSDHNSVTYNHIWDVRDGAQFSFSPDNHVAYNTLDHLRYGLHYMYSNDNSFDHNVFSDDVAGGTPMYSKRITFNDNVFAHFPGERAYAILLKDADDCVIKDNLVFESNVAFQLDHSQNALVEGNSVIDCGTAFRVLGTSTQNIFTGNSVQDNVIQVGSDYRALPNQWSLNGRGNYWSDYQGYDFSGSGLGAKPYESMNYLAQAISDQPMLELFAESPGLQAVGRGLQLFPLWIFPGIEDPHPLMHPPQVPPEFRSWLNNSAQSQNPIAFGALALVSVLLGVFLLYKYGHRRKKDAATL